MNDSLGFDPPVTWSPPTEADIANLGRSGISAAMIKAAKLFRVESSAAGQLIGQNGSGDYSSLVYPNVWPGDGSPRSFTIRRDFPDLEIKSDGTTREKAKYLSEPGRANRLYIPPGTDAALLSDSTVPVIFCEGPKKALALAEASWFGLPDGSVIPRFVVAGLAGVWSWRGVVGKTEGPNGARRDVKGTIPDLDRIPCGNGRRVLVCFDANTATNDSVAAARSMFERELSERGADVYVVEIPALDGVNGVDDLIGLWGHGPVIDLIERADASEVEDCGLIRSLAKAIQKADHFAQDAGGLLYRYTKGVYQPNAKEFIAKRVKTLLEQRKMDSKWSSHRGDEVVEYIRLDAPKLWERPPVNILNLQNGLYDLSAKRLLPHSPMHLSSIQLPVDYNATATCSAWDKFISEVFPADALSVAYEIPAWLMIPDTSIQKAVLLGGEGGNGKSVYLAGVSVFIGKHNIAAIPLHKLESDRFSVSRLMGKLANICADLPSEHLQSTSIFKALTGGDTLLAERKYADSFELTPYARLVFSANSPPRSADASHAFFRRWLVIPFERTFDGTDAIPRAELDALLAKPSELSGVLNKALAVLPSIRAKGFSEPDSMRRAREDFRQVTDPLAVWLDTETVDHSHAEVLKKSLLMAYNDHAVKAGRPPMNQQSFGRAVKRLRPTLAEAQRGADKAWVYLGIGLKAGENSYGSIH